MTTSPRKTLTPIPTNELPSRVDPFSDPNARHMCPYCGRDVLTFVDKERHPYDRCIWCGINWRAA